MYTRYAPPPAIAKPINMTQTAAQADFVSLALLAADDQKGIYTSTIVCSQLLSVKIWFIKDEARLTDTGIMFHDIQKIPTASAFVASPGILAATLRALTGLLLFTFINICIRKKNFEKDNWKKGCLTTLDISFLHPKHCSKTNKLSQIPCSVTISATSI